MNRLTEKQEYLLSCVHTQFKYQDENLEEFCERVIGKKNNITNSDFNTLINKCKDTLPATKKQLEYIRLITNKPFEVNLTRNQVSTIINKFKENMQIPVLPFIRIDLSDYKISYSCPHYLLCSQKKNMQTIKLLVFKYLLVLDWDNIDINYIKEMLKEEPYTFWIYKTKNGFHGYCMSKKFDNTENSTLNLMKNSPSFMKVLCS